MDIWPLLAGVCCWEGMLMKGTTDVVWSKQIPNRPAKWLSHWRSIVVSQVPNALPCVHTDHYTTCVATRIIDSGYSSEILRLKPCMYLASKPNFDKQNWQERKIQSHSQHYWCQTHWHYVVAMTLTLYCQTTLTLHSGKWHWHYVVPNNIDIM